MNCPKCSFDYGMRVEEFNFCPKCGERLPDLPQLSQTAWRRVQLTDLVFSFVRLIAPGMLGGGIALWFMGPAWFAYTETLTVRVISIVLMIGGPLLFALALAARKLAEDMALRGAAKNPEDRRPANIYLLLDVSRSMEGSKLSSAKKALGSFLAQVNGERDHVGLITFSHKIKEVRPLEPADGASFIQSIQMLGAAGNTALYDAVIHAIGHFQQIEGSERSNIIIAMTDGEDTASNHSLKDIDSTMATADTPVSIFTVAYGFGADMKVLRQIAQWGHGQAYKANRRTIRKLYELLSAFF